MKMRITKILLSVFIITLFLDCCNKGQEGFPYSLNHGDLDESCWVEKSSGWAVISFFSDNQLWISRGKGRENFDYIVKEDTLTLMKSGLIIKRYRMDFTTNNQFILWGFKYENSEYKPEVALGTVFEKYSAKEL